MSKRLISFFLTLLVHFGISAQDSLRNTLKLDDYITLVMNNHPVAKQADLFTAMAEAEVLKTRGFFDPKLEMDYDLKDFNDTRYYDIFNSSLKFQTWIPIDPKISVDRNTGKYLNPERGIPDENNDLQLSAGISLPIGKGLIIDERRSALKQAQFYQEIAEAERIKLVNKVLLKAIKDYWEWYYSYRKFLLLEQSVDIAIELFRRVNLDYSFGEAAMVDTIQAKITYQTRMAEFERAKFDLESSRLMLSRNLWSPDLEPLELRKTTYPDTLATFGKVSTEERIGELVNWAMENHPEILKLENKNNQLLVEQRWNRESLKPKLDLNYTVLDAPITPQGDIVTPQFTDNYKFGLDFSIPILLRKERGNLQKTNIKIMENDFMTSQIMLDIKNNILRKYAETKMSENLASQFEMMANNYNLLLQAELINLENGESDLFKLNIQQDKLIDAQMKFLKNLVNFEKNKAEMLYEIGLPFLDPAQL